MKKIILFVSLVITASVFFACSKQKTAQELMKEERRAIERFIDKNGFIITDKVDDMYNDKTGKVFFKTREGLYVHVIDSGNKEKPVNGTEVLVRFRDLIFFKTDTTRITNMNSVDPEKFVYGENTYPGRAIGLDYTSNRGVVRLIVPSSLQPYNRQSLFEPVYYGYLRYQFR